MIIKTISTNNAPAAIGPYSQALEVNGFVFCSGQIGVDPKTGEVDPTIEGQTKQVLNNLQEVVKASGSDFSHVVKTTIYLTNMTDYAKVNEIYAGYFVKTKPARATIAVASLPRGVLIEIDAIATVS